MLTFLILLVLVLIGVMGGTLLGLCTRNNILKKDIERLEQRNFKLRLENRELTQLCLDGYKYSRLMSNLKLFKTQVMVGKITGKTFCKEVARIIKENE